MNRGVLKISFLVIYFSVISALDFTYHKYDALTNVLHNFTRFPKLSPRLYSIGKSVNGNELWVMEITAANGSKIGIPNVKLIGNIHGNEAVGRELLLHFLEFLGTSYGNDSAITWLLDNTRIHILPSMNPDGFEISSEGICLGEHGRSNARSFDLNRNFPDFYNKNLFPIQPESQAIQKWMKEVPFILSAGLHGGALVANYPFDTVKEMTSLPTNPPSISPDDDVFVHLAKVYSNKHPTMHLGKSCPDSKQRFPGGITNGAAWYPFTGGMQDFNYAMHGCMELTLEISCCKYPHARKLPKLWKENKYALLDLIKQAHRGVRGIIFSIHNHKPVASAVLKITGREMNFTTTKHGEFWRILLPGKYELQIKADGYHPENIKFEILNYGNEQPKLTTLHIPLTNTSFPRPTTTTSTRLTSTSTIPTPTFSVGPTKADTEIKQGNYSEYVREQNAKDTPITLKSTAERHRISDSDYLDSGTTHVLGRLYECLGLFIMVLWFSF